MDRDFILEINKPKGYQGEAYWAQNGDNTVVLSSFIPKIDLKEPPQTKGRCIKVVVDCSGSMAGDSISQARTALIEILEQLQSGDSFNIILFGSTQRLLFNNCVLVNTANIQHARLALNDLEADLGGTKMQAALSAAYDSTVYKKVPCDLLLITDGQTWDEQSVIDSAAESNHRHFVVGVGSAVSEAFLTKLAKSTDGTSVFVTPNENMSQSIVQHFNRMSHFPITKAEMCLSDKYSTPLTFEPFPPHKLPLFDGDTVNVFTEYEGYPPATVDFYFEGEQHDPNSENDMCGASIAVTHKVNDLGLLARLAAHDRLAQLSDSKALELAEKYQLITESTSYILVKQNQHTDGLGIPELHHVPHQLPAGQSGFGSVSDSAMEYDSLMFSMGPTVESNISFSTQGAPVECEPMQSESTSMMPPISDYEIVPLDVPAFLRKSADIDDEESESNPTQTLADSLNEEFNPDDSIGMSEFDIMDLEELGEDETIIEMLYQLEHAGYNEQKLVAAWLSLYNEFNPDNKFTRHVTRLIRILCKELDIGDELIRVVKESLQADLLTLQPDYADYQ
nr:VWA domain-containing protein [Shewanella abyssi]